MRQPFRLLAIAVLGVLLTSCSVRLDHAAPTPSPASAAEQLRQRTAIDLTALGDIDPDLLTGADRELAARAGAQADLLGGVWQACPPRAAAERCEALPAAPAVPTLGADDVEAGAERAVADLAELRQGGDAAAAIAARGYPVLAALAGVAPDEESWRTGTWTTSAQALDALNWAAWQLEANAARTGDAAAATLAATHRAAVRAPYASGFSGAAPTAAYVTEDLTVAEILVRTMESVAAALPAAPAEERPALSDYLTFASARALAAGADLPDTW